MTLAEASFVAHPVADLFQGPGQGRDRQLRYGEGFTIHERRDGFAFGRSEDAGHEGWLLEAAVMPADQRGAPTHWISARQTHAFAAPDFKAPERAGLTHLSKLCVTGQEGRFSNTEIGWVPTAHLTDKYASDPVAVAEAYLGVPYLWGGNSIWGVDCSGLVHAGLLACGRSCPSDSGPQEDRVGRTLPPGTPPERGDLLFWAGHVAWVVDAATILHANVHHMAVAYEPLKAAIARIEAQGDGLVTAHKRLGGQDE